MSPSSLSSGGVSGLGGSSSTGGVSEGGVSPATPSSVVGVSGRGKSSLSSPTSEGVSGELDSTVVDTPSSCFVTVVTSREGVSWAWSVTGSTGLSTSPFCTVFGFSRGTSSLPFCSTLSSSIVVSGVSLTLSALNCLSIAGVSVAMTTGVSADKSDWPFSSGGVTTNLTCSVPGVLVN